jgi:hypothetical protein
MLEEPRKEEVQNFTIKSFFKYYLDNSTVHGTKYIAEADNWFTR